MAGPNMIPRVEQKLEFENLLPHFCFRKPSSKAMKNLRGLILVIEGMANGLVNGQRQHKETHKE